MLHFAFTIFHVNYFFYVFLSQTMQDVNVIQFLICLIFTLSNKSISFGVNVGKKPESPKSPHYVPLVLTNVPLVLTNVPPVLTNVPLVLTNVPLVLTNIPPVLTNVPPVLFPQS